LALNFHPVFIPLNQLLGAILNFKFWILELRLSFYYKLIERSDSINPKSLRDAGPYGPEAAIKNPKSEQ
jgi:hypothetical protein